MDAQEAQMRRKTWFGIPCYHPVLEQETLNESWTGLYVCQDCGSEFLKVSMWEPVHHFFLQEKKHRSPGRSGPETHCSQRADKARLAISA